VPQHDGIRPGPVQKPAHPLFAEFLGQRPL
jgi:hypothetical protein